MENVEKPIELKCSLEKDGTVTCKISTEKFIDIKKKNIKIKKVTFDVE